MIYYPIPLYSRRHSVFVEKDLNNQYRRIQSVISLPIHTELENSNQDYNLKFVFLNIQTYVVLELDMLGVQQCQL